MPLSDTPEELASPLNPAAGNSRLLRHLFSILALTVVLLGVVAVGFRLIVDVPDYGKPLELLHAEVFDVIKITRQLPVMKPNVLLQEFHQPPLYYVLVALVSWSDPPLMDRAAELLNPYFLGTELGNRNQLLLPVRGAETLGVARWFGLACILLTALLVYLQIAALFSSDIAWLGALIIGWHVQFVFISTSVSNDALVVPLVALALWWLSRSFRLAVTPRRMFIFGLLVGVAMLAKVHGLLALICVPFAVWQAYKTQAVRPVPQMLPQLLPKLLWLFVLPIIGLLLVVGPWMARNWLLYNDALALSTVTGTGHSGNLLQYALSPLPDMWRSFWLDFGPGLAGYGSSFYYWMVGLVCIVLVIGVGNALWRLPKQRIWLLMNLGFIVVTVGFSVFQKMLVLSSIGVQVAEGRHLFILLPSLAALTCAAVVALPKLSQRILLSGALTMLSIVNVVWTIGPHLDVVYGLGGDLPPALEQPFRYQNGMTLLGVSATPGNYVDKSGWWVNLNWLGERPIEKNYTVSTQLLIMRDGTPFNTGQQDSYPRGGMYPTRNWVPAQPFVEQRFIPNDGTHLGIFVYDKDTGQTVPTVDGRYPMIQIKP